MSLIEHDGYFTCLPREHYVSQELFDRELRRVFSRQWVYAGQASQVPEAGSFVVREIGPESMIIVRADDGRVRAFFNVCRHRGARICDAGETGTAKHFVCPYHRWSYGIDGRLLGAPGMRDGADFAFADWGLHEAHCGVYFGSVFVYLADEEPAQSMEDFLLDGTGDVGRLAAIQPERTRVAARRVYELDANWKALMENASECYHCPTGHPAFCVTMDVQAGFSDDAAIVPSNDEVYLGLKPGAKTLSPDGDWVCRRPLGDGMHPPGFSAKYAVFPVFCGLSYLADHGAAIAIEPVAVDRTRMTCEWIVHEDAVEGVDYDVERLIAVWDATNREDVALTERTYAGMRSLRYVPGPNHARREGMMRHGLTRYLELMDA